MVAAVVGTGVSLATSTIALAAMNITGVEAVGIPSLVTVVVTVEYHQ